MKKADTIFNQLLEMSGTLMSFVEKTVIVREIMADTIRRRGLPDSSAERTESYMGEAGRYMEEAARTLDEYLAPHSERQFHEGEKQ